MASDSKLPIAIFAALVALIAIPFLVDHLQKRRRHVLLEVRVVTATASDPVFRDGRRQVAAGESVEAALALRVGRRGRPGNWMAPVDRLAIDGGELDHRKTETWPERNFTLRVFWFSVESTNLGGILSTENAADRLSYRTFLAPEMGRGLRAERLPEAHNDDHIGRQPVTAPDGGGTFRLYARVEVVETGSDVRPLQAMTSTGIDAVLDSEFPAILRSADFGDAIDGSVGELFGLPGFEPQSETGAWNEVTVPAFRMSFTDLVSKRMVVSSRTLAAVAVTGRPLVDAGAFSSLGDLEIGTNSVVKKGRILRKLRWGVDVRAGDLLVDGEHWRVLLADDGSGVLDPADQVLHCWGRPPERTTLWATIETEEATMNHLRYVD